LVPVPGSVPPVPPSPLPVPPLGAVIVFFLPFGNDTACTPLRRRGGAMLGSQAPLRRAGLLSAKSAEVWCKRPA
jgi:hypothetical protein